MKKYEGKLIFETQDACGLVEVVDTDTLRTLHFGTPTIQSSMYLRDPVALEMEYLRKMALAWVFNLQPQRMLFLGMGGGCLPKFFWTHCPNCQLDAVEISPAVIDVSYRFFQLPHHSRLDVFCDEALTFLMQSEKSYDFIFADLFVSHGISPVVSDPAFFESCQQRLAENGVLIWNMWTGTDRETQEQTLEHLGRSFGKRLITIPNQESANYVLMMFKEDLSTQQLDSIIHNAEHVDQLTGLNCSDMLLEMRFSDGNIAKNLIYP